MKLALVVTPVVLAVRRLRARPLAAAIITLAVAGAGALIGWSSLAAALAQEDNVRLGVAGLPPDERAIQVVYHRVPFELEAGPGLLDPKETAVSVLLADLADLRDAQPARVQIWQPTGEGARLVVTRDPAEDVAVVNGRLPAGCRQRVCEALALGEDFRPGDRIRLGDAATAVVVGSGSLRPTVLPSGPSALPGIPDPGDRALLVRSLAGPLPGLVETSGTSVATTAPLDPDAFHASELRAAAGRIRRAIVRVEREETLVEAAAPLEALDRLSDRGDAARQRLLLIAGQGAALAVVFAAFAASARRRETELLDDQLATLGASRTQILASRLAEALAPSLAGCLLALAGLAVAVRVIAERNGLPGSFVAAALPGETVVTIVGVATAAAVLLSVSVAPRRRSRFGVGALELAAVTALAFVAWQAATTGGLDPDRIAAGEGAGPVLLVLPALAFFATAVLLLRLLPAALRLAERTARRGPLGLRVAFLTAARNPTQAAAATTFLAVALGSALFSLNYEATLEQHAYDEARFTAGAQWRVREHSTEEGTSAADVTPLTRFGGPATERPTPTLRLAGRVRERFASGASLDVEILALPAERIPAVLGWRESFSDLTRAEIARRLGSKAARLTGPEIAADARAVRVWARSQAGRPPRLATLHFLLPEEQRFAQLRLGVISPEWRRVAARLPRRLQGAELVGVELAPTEIPPGGVDPGGFVELGRFEARRPGGWSALPPLDGWTAGRPGGGVAEYSVIAAPFPEDAPVARGIHFDLTSTVVPLIRPAVPVPDALPAVASERAAGLGVGGTITVDVLGLQLPLRVAARASLFPTVVDDPESFVVLDYDTLFAFLNADRPGFAAPSEAWFFQRQAPNFVQRLETAPFRLESAVGVEPVTERLLNDPLAAGTRDVLSVAAIAAAALALLGLMLSTRSALGSERLLLAEYEAMGIPPATLARSLQIRLLLLSALGVAAGILGALLAVRLVGAFVAVTGASARPLPAIEPLVAWSAIAVVLAAVAIAGLATAVFLAGRTLRETAARRLNA